MVLKEKKEKKKKIATSSTRRGEGEINHYF